MLTEPLVADVIARALRGGASFAELYVERWKRRMLRVLRRDPTGTFTYPAIPLGAADRALAPCRSSCLRLS